MDENNFDPYEDVCGHEMAMRRLLSLLRQSQTYCNDIECCDLNGSIFSASEQGSSVNASEQNFFFMFCLFVLAVVLYLLPSLALRKREKNVKFRDNENDSSGGSSAPPPLC